MNAGQIESTSDDELNRAIAEALGWQITTPITVTLTGHTSFFQRGIPPGKKLTSPLPEWSTNANESLVLLAEMGGNYLLSIDSDGSWMLEKRWGGEPIWTPTAARAIAEAWLLWKGEQGEEPISNS